MTRWIVLSALCAARLGAQQKPASELKPVNGALNEAFRVKPLNETLESPRQLHELSDGLVLIGDGARLLAADFATGKVDVKSELPGGDLVALPGDSSVIMHPNGWYYLDGLRPIGMLPPSNPLVSSVHSIYGADDKGHILIQLPQRRQGDSISVALVDRVTGDRQVVTKLWPGTSVERGTFRPVCQMFERALLTRDGWLAVVRDNPYRVDWRNPSGEWALGAPISAPLIPMTQRERDVYVEWRAREHPTLPRDTIRSWPETVCPWVGGYGPIATPDAKLVVYRVPTAEAPATRYDLINRHGQVERQIAMPASDAIVGFGRNSVFVITTEGGKQTIRRRPWP